MKVESKRGSRMDFGALQYLQIRRDGKKQRRKLKRSSHCDSRTMEWCPGNQEGKMLQGGGDDQLGQMLQTDLTDENGIDD